MISKRYGQTMPKRNKAMLMRGDQKFLISFLSKNLIFLGINWLITKVIIMRNVSKTRFSSGMSQMKNTVQNGANHYQDNVLDISDFY